MSEKYKFHDDEGIYFVTSTIAHWIDLFTRKEFKHIVVDSLKYCQEAKGLVIYAWCLMPSHLHMIVSSDKEKLPAIMRDFKKFTAKKIIAEMESINESRKEWLLRGFNRAGKDLKRIKEYKVWQDGNHPILLDSKELQDQKLSYVHLNPVEAEIVYEPEHFVYSSARYYAGEKGLIDVRFLE